MKKNDKDELPIVKFDKPKICLFDFSEDDIKQIRYAGYNIESATLGSPIDLPARGQFDKDILCLPNGEIPENIHEFSIVIINLRISEHVKYDANDHTKTNIKGDKTYYFASKYPETVFDSRPHTITQLNSELQRMSINNTIVLVFADDVYKVKYRIAEVGHRDEIIEQIESDNYMTFDHEVKTYNKAGSEVRIIDDFRISNILKKYQNEIQYRVAFKHPEIWQIGNQYKKIDEFSPIVLNNNGEIVSYILDYNNLKYFVLPSFNNKALFIIDLLNEYYPGLYPDLFPHSTKNLWLDDPIYFLPNYVKLIEEQEQIKREYEAKLNECEDKISSNKVQWSFLHDLLTETGDNLVGAVIKFLEWLGFENIRNMDEYKGEKDIKEEDLQIDIAKGLLIIEVKGINGTSQDSDCSQISKIKFRRCKERNAFDVFGLYIVNHQRNLPAESRNNPPFQPKQITDAQNEERGLLTTWQLFKLFHTIENGILSKEEAREQLLNFGLIQFAPSNIKSLGKPKEFFMNNTVIILDIADTLLKINDVIFFEQNNEYSKAKIESIKLDKKPVSECSNGEVGLKLDQKIPKSSNIWVKI